MTYEHLTLELMVEDVAASIAFYQHVLGFELWASEAEDNGLIYWALIGQGTIRISFKRADRLRAEFPQFQDVPIGGTSALVLQVPDLNAHYAQVKAACELIDHPHLTTCGMYEYSLQDNSGYFLTVCAPPEG